VDPEGAGERVDRWLTSRLTELSRSQVARAIQARRVSVNGVHISKAGLLLAAGDLVSLAAPEPLALPSTPVFAPPIEVVHEDEHLLVVRKPAGLVVHRGAGHRAGTLVDALCHRFGTLSPGSDPERPGIVHRLDAETSGLLVVARDEPTHRALGAAFARHEVRRRYVAVVLGTKLADEGRIETRIGRHPRDRKRMTGRLREGGRLAATRWRVLARGEALMLVGLELETGRTHQIRVHLSEAGYPVVGDATYGRAVPRVGAGKVARELAAARRMARQALHAGSLGFVHPATAEACRFVWSPPNDLGELIAQAFGAAGEAAVRDFLQEP
jgi:23S rRNA pseudouridine1911/1915/1917 synthase